MIISPKNVVKLGVAQAVAASQTNQVVSLDPFTLRNRVRCAIAIKCSAGTFAAGISAKLWTGVVTTGGAVTYRTSADKSITISANGVADILLNPEDATDITKTPLGTHAKVTVTTGAGDAITIDEIWLVEPEAGI